jgi:hypothetical protein
MCDEPAERIQVRRHANGIGEYGDWLPLTNGKVPHWVAGAVAAAIAEKNRKNGRVDNGLTRWVWRKVTVEES